MKNRTSISSSSQGSIRLYLQSATGPLLLGLLCFFVYNANLRQIGAGDTLAARYLPLILWRDGTLDFDANAHLVASGHSMIPSRNRSVDPDNKVTYFESRAYWVVRTHHHQLASFYPIVTPLLVSPLYIPAVIWLNMQGWEQPRLNRIAELMEKVSASIIATVTSVLMYLVLRRSGNNWSLPLTIAFAFGTNTWMISSQALWQHGTGELLIVLALLLVISSASPIYTALLGAVCIVMVANRPPDALIAGAFALYTVWLHKRNALWLLAGAIVPLAALLYYNLNFIGNIFGGYALIKPNDNFFQSGWSGLLGLLVSPTRGLLIFSPFLVFIPVGLIQRLRKPSSKKLAIVLSFAVVAQILFYSQLDWRAGVSWGPRWLTDILPILVWMLAPAPLVLRPIARRLLVLTIMTSVSVQAIGAFWYTQMSDEIIFAGNPSSMQTAWDINNIPFITELQHSPASGEFLYNTNGSLDRVGQTQIYGVNEVPKLESGAVIEGWALTGGRTPAQLLVLIDGVIVGATRDFLPRADVNDVLKTNSHSGWRVSANILGVLPGERVLQVAVRIDPRSPIRIIREQRVMVTAPDTFIKTAAMPLKPVSQFELDIMAARATMLLQERQSESGYWLTAHTNKLSYEAPLQEMNTFLTSMLVDLLSPVSHQRNLDDVMARARQHLTGQIESNGLVRYHGLPDGPTIGKLGCVITPDTDDTALVWRIADTGLNDPRRQLMLQDLTHYRDVRGLYRTWLAPQKQYQCINPGIDPNPTDIAIQMHVYLMLRKFDPPAAQNLCHALQRAFWDEDIWVYYSKAPLVPYLRSAELRHLGCIIPLPADRLSLSAADQEIWSEAVHLLVETMLSPKDANLQQTIRNVLIHIGNDDFAQLRHSPPMLYHNDSSASVKRYYWSEDVGYAIWLRLYEALVVETR